MQDLRVAFVIWLSLFCFAVIVFAAMLAMDALSQGVSAQL
jgi:hypothetical protein